MLVRDIMQTKTVTVTPDTTLPAAMRLASQRGIRHLPVLEYGQLVGIVSDRDLKRAMASPATSLEAHELNYLLDRLQVREIMTHGVITVTPTSPVEDAARLMMLHKVGALPVTEAGQLVGIITETDVLELFVRALGAAEPSSRIDVLLGARPDALADVTRTLEGAGATISSIMTLRGRDGVREAVVRIATINPGPTIAALQARGYAVRDGEHDRGGRRA
jgi:acetoin utilization protein AcuB